MAQENNSPAVYNIFELSADSARKVANDQAEAVLYAERVGQDVAALQNEVNQLIGQAVREAQGRPDTVVRTGGYSVQPEFEIDAATGRRGRQSGYRVRQNLTLESQDFEGLRQLIGRLQQTLALDGLHFTLSRQARRQIENDVMVEALNAFNARAQIIAGTIGAPAFRRRQTDIQTAAPPNYRAAGVTAFAGASLSAETPELAAGETEVVVTVSGTIELSFELQR